MTTEQKCCEKVNNKTASKIPRDGSLVESITGGREKEIANGVPSKYNTWAVALKKLRNRIVLAKPMLQTDEAQDFRTSLIKEIDELVIDALEA
jgi:hypothetical protein